MAFYDVEQFEKDRVEIEADICIVGSGVVGMALIDAFLPTGFKVVVMEGGGRRREESSDDMYRMGAANLPMRGPKEGRFRVYGGSSTEWGGQALPLAPHIYEERVWGDGPWPISNMDVEPYYSKVEDILGVGHLGYTEDMWEKTGFTAPQFDRTIFPIQFSRWSPSPKLGENLWEKVKGSQNVDVYSHANLVEVGVSGDRSDIQSLTGRSIDGKEVVVRAKQYVMACGGHETPRLLLAVPGSDGKPFAADMPMAGLYYQDHIPYRLGVAKPKSRSAYDDYFENFLIDGVKYSPRLQLPGEFQKQLGLLDIGCVFDFETEEESAADAAKSVRRSLKRKEVSGDTFKQAFKAVGGMSEVMHVAGRAKRNRVGNPQSATPWVIAQMEQEPVKESCVRLTDEVDAVGLRRATIDWKITRLNQKSAKAFYEILQDQFHEAGIGEIEPVPSLNGSWEEFLADCGDHLHPMGSTRMGTDPEESVVDGELRTHAFGNLSICSSSVYPSGGYSNPSFTLVALTYRLAERMKKEI